jgi:hypothetical protein
MKIQSVIFTAVIFLLPQASQAAMDKGYYPNAREVCQLHAQMKAGKRPPVDKTRALIAKVIPINKGKNLQVTAWDESGGKTFECSCTFGPGDADLYPSVRLAEPPNCAVR